MNGVVATRARGRPVRVHAPAALLLTLALTTAPSPGPPVADAAMRGDTEAVRTLLRGGADVNAAQGDGMTALHWAARHGDGEMTGVLLYAGATVSATTRLGGYTPLHLAARTGSASVIEALLAADADPARPTSTGVTALHLAAGSGDAASVTTLLDHGVDVDARDDDSGRTPLFFAAAAGRVEAVKALLAAGADPSIATGVTDYVARSEVDGAARRRRAKILAARREAEEEERAAVLAVTDPVEELKGTDGEENAAREEAEEAEQQEAEEAERAEAEPGEEGADETEGEAEEEQAEEEQAEEEQEEEAKGSTEEESDGEAAAESELRPMSYTERVGRQGGMTPLHIAARDGRMEVARLLLEAGADIDRPTEGDRSTPLLVATINGHYDLAMYLLDQGADPDLPSDDGAAPLFTTLNNRWAPKALYPQPTAFKQQRTSYLELLEALLEAGADPNVRVTNHLWYTSYNFDLLGVDFIGATPFWRAAYATDVKAMKLLVAYGADPTIPTMRPPTRRRRSYADDEEEEDPSGLPPVPPGGPGVYPIHAASGVGYGQEYAANSHRHVPDGWLPAVRYLVEELDADVNARDYNGYAPLHHAAARGDNELIHYLVDRGADVMVVSRRGQTTVDMANGPQQRVQPFPETVALLESMGAINNHNCVSCE